MKKTRMPLLLAGVFCLLITAFQAPSSKAEISQTKLTPTGPVTATENPHGSYMDNTNKCIQCHSTHNAKAEKLLVASTNRDTCFLCHDGRGSNYDVKNGKTYDPASGTITDSVAGGFNPLAGFTSNHMIEAANSPAGGTGQTTTLVCTSCHNPHGTTNHVDLRTEVNGKSGIVVETTTPQFGSPTISPFSHKEVFSYKSGTKDADGNPTSGMSQFCSACHNDYVYTNTEGNSYDKTQHRHPDGVMLKDSQFTTLPMEGVPSGAYPNPKTTHTAGGSLTAGDYYYIITTSNDLGESKQGFVKKMTVLSGEKVTLVWDNVTNATTYSIYRAGPAAAQPTALTDFILLADSDTNKTLFTFTDNDNGGSFSFTDSGALTPSATTHPPDINSQTSPAKVFCLTCHYAHGTKTVDVSTGQSKLKRMDNMGVCENCHKK